jgi:hypothetical protein
MSRLFLSRRLRMETPGQGGWGSERQPCQYVVGCSAAAVGVGSGGGGCSALQVMGARSRSVTTARLFVLTEILAMATLVLVTNFRSFGPGGHLCERGSGRSSSHMAMAWHPPAHIHPCRCWSAITPASLRRSRCH